MTIVLLLAAVVGGIALLWALDRVHAAWAWRRAVRQAAVLAAVTAKRRAA